MKVQFFAIIRLLFKLYFSKEDVDNFFASDNGQKEEHTLEESIFKPLIGIRNDKPCFLYCKKDPKVENIHLKSIADRINLNDPERLKAKLLEYLKKKER